MKLKNIAISLFAVVATANAQLEMGFVKIGPKLVVFGDRDHPTQLFIDEVSVGATLPGGGPWAHDFARKVMDGGRYVMISARVCSTSRSMTMTLWPPNWAADPKIVGSALVLDQVYLESDPEEQAFKKRIGAIGAIVKKRIGHRAMDDELKEWLEKVKTAGGFKIPGTTCENPSAIKGYRMWVGAYPYGYGGYGYYGAGRWTVTLYVEGTPDTGYKFRVQNPTRIAQ